jgi:hypothetical protein
MRSRNYRYDGAASPTTPGGMSVIYKDLIASDERTKRAPGYTSLGFPDPPGYRR